MKVVNVSMNEALLLRLTQEAKTHRITCAALVREACQHYLTLREEELDRQYVAGYRRHPESAAVGKMGELFVATVWPREDWR
jgi:hypothetical protein